MYFGQTSHFQHFRFFTRGFFLILAHSINSFTNFKCVAISKIFTLNCTLIGLSSYTSFFNGLKSFVFVIGSILNYSFYITLSLGKCIVLSCFSGYQYTNCFLLFHPLQLPTLRAELSHLHYAEICWHINKKNK